jgi:hypothetical protein
MGCGGEGLVCFSKLCTFKPTGEYASLQGGYFPRIMVFP